MIMEYEGKTEKEAVDKAIAELGLERDGFDVEIMETEKKGFFFKKGTVKIKVHLNSGSMLTSSKEMKFEPESDCEKEIKEYLEVLLEKMGFPGTVSIAFREENKIGFSIDSEYSGILIGKKGKNLDAIQLILNVFAGRFPGSPRIIIDTENYRVRREESLVRLAIRSAEQVRRSRRSKLLEPMNPFERRVVHTALNGMEDIATKSDGEGLFKQVRIIYRGKTER
ncbi:MAG: RNA-binding cell elongation regulator Jag/EloR [Spirochaetia bacterium]|jgi:spoIIIJ-associated protein|nr:RNA-binding cell elongation regulator Jag/EloR [Spirochaetia bacterium]